MAALGFGVTVSTVQVSAADPTAQPVEICAEAAERLKSVEPDPAVDPKAVVVLTYKFNFCPKELTIKAGTKVQWVNVEKRTNHSVWLKDAGIDESARFFPGDGWRHTFEKAGKYPYLCGPHGVDEKMTGLITVE